MRPGVKKKIAGGGTALSAPRFPQEFSNNTASMQNWVSSNVPLICLQSKVRDLEGVSTTQFAWWMQFRP